MMKLPLDNIQKILGLKLPKNGVRKFQVKTFVYCKSKKKIWIKAFDKQTHKFKAQLNALMNKPVGAWMFVLCYFLMNS